MPKWDNSGHLGVKESLHNEEMQGMGGSSISMVTKGRERGLGTEEGEGMEE